MDFKDFPHEFSLRHQVLVLSVFSESVLKFATELADADLANLSEEDKAIYDALADYLERASYTAEKLQKRVRRS